MALRLIIYPSFAVKNEAALITVGGLTIGAILAPSIAPLALGIAGFTPIGPLAGTYTLLIYWWPLGEHAVDGT